MLRWLVMLSLLVEFGGSAIAENCPSGTLRMIKDGEVICVPYGQGSPDRPPPPKSNSTITLPGDDVGPDEPDSGVTTAQ